MLREISKVEQRYDAVLAVIRDGMAVTRRTNSSPMKPGVLHQPNIIRLASTEHPQGRWSEHIS
jgi:hypothetical protein